MTYSSVHDRLRSQRGSARNYLCVDCGGQAYEWSYDGNDPEEKTDWGHKYSVNTERYEPRCRSCHNKYDGKLPPYHSGETHPRAKLSDADIVAIQVARLGGESAQRIADRYGVTSTHIRRLLRGKRSQ